MEISLHLHLMVQLIFIERLISLVLIQMFIIMHLFIIVMKQIVQQEEKSLATAMIALELLNMQL